MPVHIPMSGRDPTVDHRPATPLELFFDLTFVVAVAQAAAALHHELVEGHPASIVTFALTFFAIWWAWMNFTWFASAYDTDDVPYRVTVFVQMTGVLVLAAGVPQAFAGDGYAVVTVGYVIMRLALVAQWIRAAVSDPGHRRTALRYAAGITVAQIGWVLRLLVPDGATLVSFVALALVELVVPVWAEAAGRTSWHPLHIAERYGLFTIIVLGESILAATIGVQEALDADSSFGDLATVVVGGLLIVFSMWWVYFELPREQTAERVRATFGTRASGAYVWGYGHYLVFAAVAATGAGLAIAVDQTTDHSALSDTGAGATVTIPVALFLMTVWLIHRTDKAAGAGRYVVPGATAVILATTFSPVPVLATGLVLVVVVASTVVSASGDRASHGGAEPI